MATGQDDRGGSPVAARMSAAKAATRLESVLRNPGGQTPRDEPIGVFVNSNTNSIQFIDPLAQHVSNPYLAGPLGSGGLLDVVITGDGKTAIISNFSDNLLFFIDISGGFAGVPTIAGSVSLPFYPQDLESTPDGKYVLVTDGGYSPYIGLIDVASRTLSNIFNFQQNHAQAISITPDGQMVFTADYTNGMTHQYRLTSNGDLIFVKSINFLDRATWPSDVHIPKYWENQVLPFFPVNIAISPDGSLVLVQSGGNNQAATLVRDPQTGEYSLHQLFSPAPFSRTQEVYGTVKYKSQSCVFSHDGKTAYYFLTSNEPKSYIVVIDLASEILGTSPAGGEHWLSGRPRNITWNVTGKSQVIPSGPGIQLQPPRSFGNLFGVDTIALDPSGDYLYVTNPTVSGGLSGISIIDLITESQLITVPAQGIPTGIAFSTITDDDESGVPGRPAGTAAATANGLTTHVKIEFSTDNGLTWTTITESTPNNGSYSWNVPDISSTRCRILISDAVSSAPLFYSEAAFAIGSAGELYPGTSLIVPHVVSNGVWDTLLETVNAGTETRRFLFQGFNEQGVLVKEGDRNVSLAEAEIPGRGLYKVLLSGLFPEAPAGSVAFLKVTADANLEGKLLTGVTYVFGNGGQWSGALFSKTEAWHRTRAGHLVATPETGWYTGYENLNTTIFTGNPVPVDVYFTTFIDGQQTVLKFFDDLQPGQKDIRLLDQKLDETAPLLDKSKVASGMFSSYSANSTLEGVLDGTASPVDGLFTMIVYGQIPGRGLCEGYVARGETAGGLNNYASQFYIPLNLPGIIKAGCPQFTLESTVYNAFSIQNVSTAAEQLAISHHRPDGSQSSAADVNVPAGERRAHLDSSLGFDATAGGMWLALVESGDGAPAPASMEFLAGDNTGPEGMSFVTGGTAPSSRDEGRLLVAPVTSEAGQGTLLSIMNPRNEIRTFSIVLRDPSGALLDPLLVTDNLVLPPFGTYSVDIGTLRPSMIGTAWITADGPVAGAATYYSVDPAPGRTNMTSKIMAVTNE